MCCTVCCTATDSAVVCVYMLHTAMRCVVQPLSLPSSLYLVLYVDVSTLSQEDLSHLSMSICSCNHQSCVTKLTREGGVSGMELAGDHMEQPSTLKQYRVTRAMHHSTVHTKQHNTRTTGPHDLLWHWSSLVSGELENR